MAQPPRLYQLIQDLSPSNFETDRSSLNSAHFKDTLNEIRSNSSDWFIFYEFLFEQTSADT